jgi:uncharacterized membrane protein HdeD (DUF308 family)
VPEPSHDVDMLGELRVMRWVSLVIGVVCLVAGVIVLLEPSSSLATLAVVTGIFLLVDGIFELVAVLVTAPGGRALRVVLSIACAIIGIILIRHPTHSVVAIALLLGLWLIIAGAVRLATALTERASRLWNAGVAALELIAGIVIVASPDIGVATLALLVGIAFILRGLALCGVAWMIHGLEQEADRPAHTPATAT